MMDFFNVIGVAGIFPTEISMVLSSHLKDSNFREVAYPSIVPQYWLNIVWETPLPLDSKSKNALKGEEVRFGSSSKHSQSI